MSYEIPVFRAEVDAGVADAVRSAASVAYVVEVEAVGPEEELAGRLRSAAADNMPESPHGHCPECGSPGVTRVGDEITCGNGHAYPSGGASASAVDPDLFLIRDVLVSTVWNVNDDVFLKEEAYPARHTCDNKPFNFGHDQSDVIGFIASSQAVDASMNPLPDPLPLEEVPDLFHVVNGSVIWRNVGGPERVALIEKTVAEIRNREWCVSMECFFRGFDYAVRSPDGSRRVVARANETAFLTKHLRAYGGTGAYTDPETGGEYRLGRVLRNITFCGKGLVRRPANPDSVILTSASVFKRTDEKPVYLFRVAEPPPVETTMSEVNLEAVVAELRAANDKLAKDLTDLRSQENEAAVAGLRAELASRDEAAAGLNAQIATLSAAATAAGKRADEAEAALAAARVDLDALRSEKTAAARLAVATAAGLEAARASELVANLASLDDAAFAAIVAAAGPKAPRPSETDQIDNATPEKDAALAAVTEPEAESAVAAMAAWFGENVLLKRPATK